MYVVNTATRNNWTAQPDLDGQMSVVGVGVVGVGVAVCHSAVSKTADIMTLSVSFRYGKWVVPLTAHEGRPPTTIVV